MQATLISGPIMAVKPADVMAAKTKTIKVKAATADMLADIAEASGKHVWEVVERMIAADLPAEHKAVQAHLKRVREQKAQIAKTQEQARRDLGG